MAGVKAAELIVICFMLLQGFVAAFNCTSPTPAALFDQLAKHLFSNKLLRPVETFAKPINISISITVAGILGVFFLSLVLFPADVFFSISLALMVASLLETLFITNIQYKPREYSAVPHWLSVLVLRYLAVLVCIPPKERSNRVTVSLNPSHKAPSANTSATSLSDHQSISDVTLSGKAAPASLDSPEPVVEQLRMLGRELTAIRVQMDKYCQGTKATQEWEMIGTVTDRLLFGLYIIFIFVSFITIISIWIWHNSFAT
ncbi:unnamed protein product [Oreochromis niloticus]|nr:unnamed protein product [Mustela putorius furo]